MRKASEQEQPTAAPVPLLRVSGLSKQQERGLTVDSISFSQAALQKVALAGETGSGKSTLLKMIAGLVQPDAGTVHFQQERVKGPAEKLVPGHAGIAYLSQHSELPDFLRVEQVLKYANILSPSDATTLYEVCRISHLLSRKTNQLSGGEKQRIALARLLTSSPRLLLLDEPFSNLDRMHKSILKEVIEDIGERLQITCLLVSHDAEDTLSWADELLILKDGKLVQQGSPEQLYRHPLNAYVAGLLGKYNRIPAALNLALRGIQADKASKQRYALVRPESFTLSTTPDRGLAAEVEKVSFYGSYYELAVKLPQATVTVRTAATAPAKGSTVYVSLPENQQ